MSQNLSSAAVVIGALRVKSFFIRCENFALCLNLRSNYVLASSEAYDDKGKNAAFSQEDVLGRSYKAVLK